MLDLRNCDNMDLMREFPDKHFDLAIVDPPYGGGQHFNFRFGTGNLVYDSHKPDKEYWREVFRISNNQIVWGANYFASILPENRGWIVWFKGNPLDSFSDFELAWTSYDIVAKSIILPSYGFNHPDKKNEKKTIHPTQKPIALYKWLLKNYAKQGNKIFDSHLGSQSSRIAAYKLGFDFWGCELDKDYFDQGNERFKKAIAEPLFDNSPEYQQSKLFT